MENKDVIKLNIRILIVIITLTEKGRYSAEYVIALTIH